MLFPPLTHLEVVGSPFVEMIGDKPVLVVTIKVNINLKAGTIEDSLSRRRGTIVSIGEGVKNDLEFDFSIVSSLILSTSTDLVQQATSHKNNGILEFKNGMRALCDKMPEWFNNDKNFQDTLKQIMDLKLQIFQSFFSDLQSSKDSKIVAVPPAEDETVAAADFQRLLGSILAECAQRGKAELCTALLKSAEQGLVNWRDAVLL